MEDRIDLVDGALTFHDELCSITSDAQSIAVASADFKAGPRAFIEKREPRSARRGGSRR